MNFIKKLSGGPMVRISWSPMACRVSAKSKIHTDLAFQDSNMDWIMLMYVGIVHLWKKKNT